MMMEREGRGSKGTHFRKAHLTCTNRTWTEFHHDTTSISRAELLDVSSSSPCAFSPWSSSNFSPTTRRPTRTPPFIPVLTIGNNSIKKKEYCPGMEIWCKEDKVNLQQQEEEDLLTEEGLSSLMLLSDQHPAKYASNDGSNDAPAESLFARQHLNLATNSSSPHILDDDLLSLSSNADYYKGEDGEEPATKEEGYLCFRSTKQEEIETNRHFFDHFCHKAQTPCGSDITSGTTARCNTAGGIINRPGTWNVGGGISTDNMISRRPNAAQYQSTFVHASSSLLENEEGRKTRTATKNASPISTIFLSFFGQTHTPRSGVPNENYGYAIAHPCTTMYDEQQQSVNCVKNTQDVDLNMGVSSDSASIFSEHLCSAQDMPRKSSLLCAPTRDSPTTPDKEEGKRPRERLLLGSKKVAPIKNDTCDNMDSLSGCGKVIPIALPPPLKPPSAIWTTSDGQTHKDDTYSPDADSNRILTKKKDHDDKKSDQWYLHFQELVEYKKTHGHCSVPYRYKNENPFLAAWVKRQRYQYKCKRRGKHSHLTDEREGLLEQLGFVWDAHVSAWEENFALMAEFQKKHGHCCVPIKQKELREWGKRQRRYYKQRQQEQAESSTVNSSIMSDDRIRRLNEIQFQWGDSPKTRRPGGARNKDLNEASHKKRRTSSMPIAEMESYLGDRR